MQTEKLTLAQLSGYLAYGLKMKSSQIGIWQLNPCSFREDGTPRFGVSKPLVIPLDQLTEAQWIEVFKAGFEETLSHGPYYNKNEAILTVNKNDIEVCFGKVTVLYDVNNFQFDADIYAFNQLAAFAKLHELHADLHGLIEKGLALNKLDYEL